MFLALFAVSHSEASVLPAGSNNREKENESKVGVHLRVFFCFIYEAIAYGLQAMIPDDLSIAPNLLWKGLLKV